VQAPPPPPPPSLVPPPFSSPLTRVQTIKDRHWKNVKFHKDFLQAIEITGIFTSKNLFLFSLNFVQFSYVSENTRNKLSRSRKIAKFKEQFARTMEITLKFHAKSFIFVQLMYICKNSKIFARIKKFVFHPYTTLLPPSPDS
jgi:hypothetical protein